jgi:hypothetical protein
MQPQVGIAAIGRRLVQVGGHAELAGDPDRANRVFLLTGNGQIRAIGGAGCAEPRRGEEEAQRSTVLRDRDDRMSPR